MALLSLYPSFFLFDFPIILPLRHIANFPYCMATFYFVKGLSAL